MGLMATLVMLLWWWWRVGDGVYGDVGDVVALLVCWYI